MRENERDFHYSMDATLKKYLDRKRKLAAGTSSAKTTAEKKNTKRSYVFVRRFIIRSSNHSGLEAE